MKNRWKKSLYVCSTPATRSAILNKEAKQCQFSEPILGSFDSQERNFVQCEASFFFLISILESFFLQLRSIFGNEKKSHLRRRSGYEGRKKAIFFTTLGISRNFQENNNIERNLDEIREKEKEGKRKKEMTSKR